MHVKETSAPGSVPSGGPSESKVVHVAGSPCQILHGSPVAASSHGSALRVAVVSCWKVQRLNVCTQDGAVPANSSIKFVFAPDRGTVGVHTPEPEIMQQTF